MKGGGDWSISGLRVKEEWVCKMNISLNTEENEDEEDEEDEDDGAPLVPGEERELTIYPVIQDT